MNTKKIYEFITGFSSEAAEVDNKMLLDSVKQLDFLRKTRDQKSANTVRIKYQVAQIISAIGNQDFDTLCQGVVANREDSIIKELGWHMECSVATASVINKFNVSRKKFGSQLLLGEYTKANATLCKIRQDHGLTLYYIEKSLLLEQARSGTNAARKLAEAFASKFTKPGYKILTNLFRLRTEGLLLQWPFEQYLKGLFELDESEFAPFVLQEIIFFSDCVPSLYQKKDVDELVSRIGSYSVVDKYLASLRCIRILLHQIKQEEVRKRIASMLRDASTYIVDDHLSCLLQLADKNVSLKLNENEKTILRLQGNYLRGDFHSTFINAQKYLLEDATKAPLYDLIAKSLIHSIEDTGVIQQQIGGLSRRIILLLVNLYSETSATAVITSELDAIAVALGDNHLSHFIRSVAQRYRNSVLSEQHFRYGALSKRGRIAPIIFESNSSNTSFINLAQSDSTDEALAIKYCLALSNSDTELLGTLEKRIHAILFNLAKARLYARESKWQDVLNSTNSITILQENENSPDFRWIRQLSTYRLIALMALGKWHEARELLTYCIRNLENFIYIADFQTILGLIHKSNQEDYFELELLLIRCATSPDLHLRALQLREIMETCKVHTVDELLALKKWYQEPLARWFFLDIFSPDVLKYVELPMAKGQNSTDRAYQEFILVCLGFIVAVGIKEAEELHHPLVQAIVRQRERNMQVAVDGARVMVGLEGVKTEICSIISSITDIKKGAGEKNENYQLIDRCFELL